MVRGRTLLNYCGLGMGAVQLVWDILVWVFLGKGVVQVLWIVRNGSGPAGVGSIITDICHLVTPGQGADSRKWSVCHLCYEVGGGVSGHGNIHCTALTHIYIYIFPHN